MTASSPPPRPRPLIALLAAGRAARFGADKLAQPLAEVPLGRHAAAAALATGLPVLCIGSTDRPAWLPDEAAFTPNPAAAHGLGTSVALAARIAAAEGYPALMVHLADLPLVPATLLRELAAGPVPAACRYPSGQPGVPAIFPAALYPALERLVGDRGAGNLLATLPGLRLVDCAEWWLHDVDTPDALAEAEAIYAAQHKTNRRPGG